jgi:hypothetical protein
VTSAACAEETAEREKELKRGKREVMLAQAINKFDKF